MPEAVPHSPPQSIFAPDGKVIGDRLSAKPFLEPYRESVEADLRGRRLSRKDRLWVEGQVKLSMYYADQYVLVWEEADDWVVVAHGEPDEVDFFPILKGLTPEQRRRVLFVIPEPFDLANPVEKAS